MSHPDPARISIIDGIPVAALIVKSFRGARPEPFPYLGLGMSLLIAASLPKWRRLFRRDTEQIAAVKDFYFARNFRGGRSVLPGGE